MKHYLLHLRARIRAIYALLAFSAVSLSVEAQETTSYSVVFSHTTDFKTKVEVPMVAALYRNNDMNGHILPADKVHTQDNSRWQISLKYDDPRWKDIPDGTVYWYIKSHDGKIIGPNNNGENMDDGKDNSASGASVPGRMLYKSESSLKTDGTESTFTYFKCTKGKESAVSCTFAYATAAAKYESSGNNGSQLTYGNPSVQYWRNKSGIKYSLTYNTTSSSSLPLPYYDGTFCYVKKPAGWGKICAWVYDDNKTQYSSASNWPGEELTTTAEYDGQTYYLWKMGSDKTGTPTQVTFNDGNGDTKVKTGDLTFKSGNIYDASTSTDYILGTVTKQSDATDPTAAYEKFYAYGFWGASDKDKKPEASFKEMSPVVYYNAKDRNVVDSVVYYVNMSKVNASFDNFFFMFCSQRYMESWDKWMTNDGKGAWDFVWRPEIFDNRDCNTLSGALYQAGNDLSTVLGSEVGASYYTDSSHNPLGFNTNNQSKLGKNQMQSINPLLDDEHKKKYDSYTLSLNVTTGTYNVEFHNAIQIVGPAVESGTNWTVDNSRKYSKTENVECGTWNKEKAITLKPSDDGTYYYTTVKLKAGEKFRFIENNKYLTNFGEDDVTPSATDFAPATEKGDVCYYNHISRNTLTKDENPTGISGESKLSTGKDITFTMPGLKEGEIYETEIRVSANNPFDQQMTGKAAPFYTITRPVKLFNYGNDGKGYTSFACNYPLEIVGDKKDVKVYDIISYDMKSNKVTLRDKSSDFMMNTRQYIPAKSGVILSTTATDKVSTITVRPMIEKLGETVDNGSNLLKAVYLPGQTINMTIPATSVNTGDPVTSRQYLFSWVKQSDESYKLGFLRSKTGKSVSERAYLSLTGEAVGATTLNPKDEAAYERVEGISTDDETVFGAKEYQVGLFFEGSEDDTVTGIHTLNHPIADKEGYYTLQGIRVNKPTTAGIYIHNGKKIVVK